MKKIDKESTYIVLLLAAVLMSLLGSCSQRVIMQDNDGFRYQTTVYSQNNFGDVEVDDSVTISHYPKLSPGISTYIESSKWLNDGSYTVKYDSIAEKYYYSIDVKVIRKIKSW